LHRRSWVSSRAFRRDDHNRRAQDQLRLDLHSRAFIALSPFLVLAATDGEGGLDASPRGDAPGFVRMPDDDTLIIPDRPGTRRVDSFSNVVRHPGVG
jgi:predicted pyridoxine 5'-phosphate oxidase superfamily flavin-nucleotide-binding protein